MVNGGNTRSFFWIWSHLKMGCLLAWLWIFSTFGVDWCSLVDTGFIYPNQMLGFHQKQNTSVTFEGHRSWTPPYDVDERHPAHKQFSMVDHCLALFCYWFGMINPTCCTIPHWFHAQEWSCLLGWLTGRVMRCMHRLKGPNGKSLLHPKYGTWGYDSWHFRNSSQKSGLAIETTAILYIVVVVDPCF